MLVIFKRHKDPFNFVGQTQKSLERIKPLITIHLHPLLMWMSLYKQWLGLAL